MIGLSAPANSGLLDRGVSSVGSRREPTWIFPRSAPAANSAGVEGASGDELPALGSVALGSAAFGSAAFGCCSGGCVGGVGWFDLALAADSGCWGDASGDSLFITSRSEFDRQENKGPPAACCTQNRQTALQGPKRSAIQGVETFPIRGTSIAHNTTADAAHVAADGAPPPASTVRAGVGPSWKRLSVAATALLG